VTNTTTEAPVSVTFKTGTAQYSPQITVRGNTVQEVVDRLFELQPDLAAAGDLPVADLIASFGVSVVDRWAKAATALEGVVLTPAKPNSAVPASIGGQAPQSFASAPESGGAYRVEEDKWGGKYTHNHPKAPPNPYGTSVLREWTAQSGKKMARFVDPRDPKIPSVYATNGKDAPADLGEGSWANV
jgi:hypothetical protein